VREGALVLLLVPLGVPAVLTLAVGLVWETIVISGALLAGLLSFSIGHFSTVTSTPATKITSTLRQAQGGEQSRTAAQDELVVPRS
jgi:hypothetical protein